MRRPFFQYLRSVKPALLVFPFLVASGGCDKEPSGKLQVAAVPVEDVVVGAPTLHEDGAGLVFAAILRRDREATLSFRIPGVIAAMPGREGMELSRGGLIAAINGTPFRAASAQQSAEVDRLTRAAARYARLVLAGAVSEAQARDARDELAAARARLESARYDLASTRLVMPFAGVVLARYAEFGETVGPGAAVVKVADRNSALIAAAQVSSGMAVRLRPGQSARVAIAGLAEPVPGRVLRIGGVSNPGTGTVSVDLALASGLADFPSGTPASVRFEDAGSRTGSAASALPAEALLDANRGRGSVFVIEKGRARRHVVRILGFDDRNVLISGLPAGTRVVTAGAGFITEGQAVTVAGL